MAQTASVLSTEQSLYISQDEPALNVVGTNITVPAINQELVFVDSPAVFIYGDRSRYRFDVSAEHTQHFALIRGLIDFNRPKGLNVVFQAKTKSFETDIESADYSHLDGLLSLVNTLLLKEVHFKTKLKEVIQFEAHYRKEKNKVYDGLQGIPFKYH